MDKYDLLEAMGEIRDRYIEEAALPFTAAPEQTSAEPASTSQVTGTNHQIKAAAAGRKRKKLLLPLWKSRNSHLRKYGRYWRRKVTTASPRRSVSCWKSTEHRDCPKSIPPTMRHL